MLNTTENELEIVEIDFEELVNSLNGLDEFGLPKAFLGLAINDANDFAQNKESEISTGLQAEIKADLSETHSALILDLKFEKYDEFIGFESICTKWTELKKKEPENCVSLLNLDLEKAKKQTSNQKLLNLYIIPVFSGGDIQMVCTSMQFYIIRSEMRIIFVCDQSGTQLNEIENNDYDSMIQKIEEEYQERQVAIGQ